MMGQQSSVGRGCSIFDIIGMIFPSCIKIKQPQPINPMKKHLSQHSFKIQHFDPNTDKASLPTLPIIPIRFNEPIRQQMSVADNPEAKCYSYLKEEKEIPEYNFQFLFRKKSHIRLARKKNKEEEQKRNSTVKIQSSQKEAKYIQKGHWTQEENKLYHWFLEIHNRHFIQKHLRRADKIFKSMAIFIQTRQAEQCRSHHQKMQKKYHTFYQILLKLRMENYSTTKPEPLKMELEECGHNVEDFNIISEHELKNGNMANFENRNQDIRSENSIKQEAEEEEYMSSQKHNSLLGENYEKGLEFKLKYQ